jgi:transcriptional regulator with XRE-family HTH domain
MEQDGKDIYKLLGAGIKRARKAANMTQMELEVASGISAGDISKMENGLINPAFSTLVKLTKALKIEISDLYRNSDHN